MIQPFLSAYAAALLSLSPEKIAEFYQTPFTVYSDQRTRWLIKIPRSSTFGIKPYEQMNITKATPKILSEEKLSKNLFAAKVRWINYNKEGETIAEETNFYIPSKR